MDLFRHAIHLGYHPQAAVGYCHWVLTTLLDPQAKRDDPLYSYVIVNMHAIPVAADAMTWYIGEKKMNLTNDINNFYFIVTNVKYKFLFPP